MPTIAEIFAPDTGKKKNNNVEIAALLRVLAKLLDESEEMDTNKSEEGNEEVLTRPHFTPSSA
jgi:hypothetical protein